MRNSLLFLSIILITACESEPESIDTPDQVITVTTEAKSPEEFEIKKRTPIQLPIGTKELADDPFFKNNHYGSFFDDQLSCYVIDTDDGEIAGARVSKVVLFYIDKVLQKKKYILESNPIAQIKPEIKKFRVKSLTSSIKDICEDKSNKECADFIIAQNQFQFSWKKDNLDYQLYNWESENDRDIYLTEKRSDYKEALKFAKFKLKL